MNIALLVSIILDAVKRIQLWQLKQKDKLIGVKFQNLKHNSPTQ